MDPNKADYQFILGETLFWQGNFDQARQVMLHGQTLQNSGSKGQFSIDSALERIEKNIKIIGQINSDRAPNFDSLSSAELVEVGQACGLAEKFQLAIEYYNRGLAKEVDPFRRSVTRHDLLLRYVSNNLRRNDLSNDARKAINAVCLKWMQEQFDFVPQSLQPPHSTAELINTLQGPSFDFARKLVDDTRVEPGVRAGLKNLLTEIQQAHKDVLDN
jgi:hypothetical protein